jgi:hypothetical protein
MRELARLLGERNAIDAKISKIIHRPTAAGHAGEWIAAQIFDIELESNAVMAAYDGRFRGEPLVGRTVNVKWYLKQEGILDMTNAYALDFYFVLTGPAGPAGTSRGGTRPWLIESVYLFDAHRLLDELRLRNVKIGVATSVRRNHGAAAEIYPNPSKPTLTVSSEQAALLQLFAARKSQP